MRGATMRLVLRCVVRVLLPVHERTPATRQRKGRAGLGLGLPVTRLVSQAEKISWKILAKFFSFACWAATTSP